MGVILRGRFMETDPAGAEETTGFSLEGVEVVEADPVETSGPDVEGTTVNLDVSSAVSGENWTGQEVVVEGHFRGVPPQKTSRRVFVVESIDET